MSEQAAGAERRSDAVSALALCAGIVVAWIYDRSAPQHTPVDTALPLIALILSFVAWLVRERRVFAAIACSVPLLIGWSMAAGNERLRLIGFGLIAAAAFGAALYSVDIVNRARAAGFVLAAVALLRWLGRERVEPGRELLILIGCLFIAAATDGRKLGIALAIVAALVSPAIPARTVAIPTVVGIVCWIVFLRPFPADPQRTRRPSVVIEAMSVFVVAATVLVFPWSGVAARALPYFWRAQAPARRVALNWALVPGESVALELPDGASSLIVSGANALQFHPGRIVGRIDPGATPIRIGQIADWGYARRDQFWKSHNVLPADPAGQVRDYGYDAWIDGAGRIPLPAAAHAIRITADRSLPPDFRLQVEAIEVVQR